MPRAPRLHAPDLIYHVFARGNNRENIFFEEDNYLRFLENLERYRKSFEYRLYAYCLLPNHFHLLIKVNTVPLSKIMQVIMTAYTMHINKKYDRVGHLFQGRFQSIIVEKDNYLLQVQRYIHLNPIKAKIAHNPKSYKWSSYLHYLINSNDILKIDTEEILTMFSRSKNKQKLLFHQFTIAGISDKFDPIKQQVRGILGSAKFVHTIERGQTLALIKV